MYPRLSQAAASPVWLPCCCCTARACSQGASASSYRPSMASDQPTELSASASPIAKFVARNNRAAASASSSSSLWRPCRPYSHPRLLCEWAYPLIPRRERQLNGLLEVRLPDIIRGPADVGTGEHTMDSRLPGLVAKLREGLQGGALRDNAVVEMSLVKEVVRETPGELPRVPVRLSLGRLRYHRQQRAMFPCEPGHRLRAIGEFVKGHGSM